MDIQSMLVNPSKQGSNQSQTSSSLSGAWHSSAPACLTITHIKQADVRDTLKEKSPVSKLYQKPSEIQRFFFISILISIFFIMFIKFFINIFILISFLWKLIIKIRTRPKWDWVKAKKIWKYQYQTILRSWSPKQEQMFHDYSGYFLT